MLIRDYHRTSPLRSVERGTGMLVPIPAPIRIGRRYRRLAENYPADRPPLFLSRLFWTMFLVFWLLGWLLRVWGMAVGSFDGWGSSKGIEYYLYAETITPADVALLRAGEPHGEPDSPLHMVPGEQLMSFWSLSADGSIQVNEPGRDLGDILEAFCEAAAVLEKPAGMIVVEPHPGSTYQHVVSALDLAATTVDSAARPSFRWGPRCAEVVLVSRADRSPQAP